MGIPVEIPSIPYQPPPSSRDRTMSESQPLGVEQGVSSLVDAIIALPNATANWVKNNASVIVGIGLGVSAYYLIYTKASMIPLIRRIYSRLR